MTLVNGRIPESLLGDIPGPNAGLLKACAQAYTAMHFHSLKVTGVSLHLIDSSIGRAYRNFARQVIARNFWCSQGKCGNAALPGTSNHGWGTTVDLMSFAQRNAIDRIGAPFGWSKSWSDASWEWWHIRYQGGHFVPKPDLLRRLGPKRRRACERLLYHRRERIREARTGKGRRWRLHNRWVKFWYGLVEKYHRRAAAGEQKRIMGLVLADRNGRI